MDRIKTKLIIAVTNRLSAAADTDARTELIEELSENLYQRYLDLTASGVEAEAAYARALEELGDVEELLEYLRTQDPGAQPPRQDGQDSQDSGHTAASFDFDNMVRGAEDIVRETISQTRDAVDQAKVIVRDVAHKFKERYPHAGAGERGSGGAETVTFPAETLTGLSIDLISGDVDIRVDSDPSAPLVLTGDPRQLKIALGDDGVLSIRPDDKTASAAFFSIRGFTATDVELVLPARHLNGIHITTVSGDVDIHDSIDVSQLTVKTASGDVDLRGVSGSALVDSASGDVDLRGSYADLSVRTASGDVDLLDGSVQALTCATASGDADLRLLELPQTLEVSAKSGDCDLRIPDGRGFCLRFHTVSGDLDTNFDMVGTLSSRSREAMYLDGGSCSMSVSTISGDLTLRRL